jgi:hypothetical protein
MVQPRFFYELKNGTTVYDRPDIRQCYLENVGWKRGYEEHHKEKGPSKTNPQLAYYYAVVIETAFQQMRSDGNDVIKIDIAGKIRELPLTVDLVDLVLKDAYAKSIGVPKVLKTFMSKTDCMALIDFSIRWCACYLHCVIPDPDPNWREKVE